MQRRPKSFNSGATTITLTAGSGVAAVTPSSADPGASDCRRVTETVGG